MLIEATVYYIWKTNKNHATLCGDSTQAHVFIKLEVLKVRRLSSYNLKPFEVQQWNFGGP